MTRMPLAVLFVAIIVGTASGHGQQKVRDAQPVALSRLWNGETSNVAIPDPVPLPPPESGRDTQPAPRPLLPDPFGGFCSSTPKPSVCSP